MPRRFAVTGAALLLVVSCPVWAYVVTNTGDSGTGSLRWCITQANSDADRDVIEFDSELSGATIQPLTFLPAITEPTEINGDVDGDGDPDIWLDGTALAAGNGLRVSLPLVAASGAAGPAAIARNCSFIGLAITNFPGVAILIQGGSSHRVRSCHIGAGITGLVASPCGAGSLRIHDAPNCTIGSAVESGRNVIYCGAMEVVGYGHWGILLVRSPGARVIGNYLGIRRDGLADLDEDIEPTGAICCQNGGSTQIGGKLPGERNFIGGVAYGIRLSGETGDTIQGNWFGFGPDGDTDVPVTGLGVELIEDTADTLVGGAVSAARNVFGMTPEATGIYLNGSGTSNCRVQGNLLGSNPDGTEFRPLEIGVRFSAAGDGHVVGGSTAAAGNYIAASREAIGSSQTDEVTVRYNKLGLRLDGAWQVMENGVRVATGGPCYVRDNTIVRAERGVYVYGLGEARVYGNTFRSCEQAVSINGRLTPATCLLGNLGNTSTTDDGGNVFRSTNTWFIYNDSSTSVRAEGNSFDTTEASEIDAKIWDRLDDAGLGRVDYRPLAGGVAPTAAPLTVASAAAVPTDAGAEVVFSLSADAAVTVEVLNMAGRIVAAPLRDAAQEAGLQRIAWTRQTLSGTRAPGGLYLARVTARTPTGETAQTLCRVPLR